MLVADARDTDGKFKKIEHSKASDHSKALKGISQPLSSDSSKLRYIFGKCLVQEARGQKRSSLDVLARECEPEAHLGCLHQRRESSRLTEAY